MNLQTALIFNLVLIGVTVVLSVGDILLGFQKKTVLRLNQKHQFPVTGGGTLLDALSENRIFIPSACGGKGTCGHCKVKVDGGGGDILPTEESFLSREERRDGVRLACQVKTRDDIDVTLPDEVLLAKEYVAEVASLEDLNYDTKFLKLRLLSPESMDFKPGQYVQILVPGYEEFRAYSIASPPSRKDVLEFVIRYVPKGLCTTFIHRALQVGDLIKFTGPYGDFHLEEDSDRDVICIGGGSGMAPMKSIVSHLREQGMLRNVRFYFGARKKKDLYFIEQVREIEEAHPNFKFCVALSEPDDDWEGDTGFITDVLQKYESSMADHEIYLCGPPPMIDAALELLAQHGVPEDRIFVDKF